MPGAGDQPVGGRAGDEVLDACGARAGRRSSAPPYSTKLSGSSRSSTFSRAVRRPALVRAAGSGRGGPRRGRSGAASRTRPGRARTWSGSVAVASCAGASTSSTGARNATGTPAATVSPTFTATASTRPAAPACDDVLHLHRLEHHELGAGRDDVALGDLDRDDDAVGGARRRPGAGRGLPTGARRAAVGRASGTSSGRCASTKAVSRVPSTSSGRSSSARSSGDVHRDAVDVELGQRAPRPHRGLRGTEPAVTIDLREQRVVAGADGEPGVAVGVDAHPAPARRLERGSACRPRSSPCRRRRRSRC